MKKLALVPVALLASASVFAQEADPAANVISAINSNMASATTIVTTAGLALIALSFVGFVLRKGRRAANGRI